MFAQTLVKVYSILIVKSAKVCSKTNETKATFFSGAYQAIALR
jgi:hypothetical protein